MDIGGDSIFEDITHVDPVTPQENENDLGTPHNGSS
jgi:hypothetical protein